MFNKKSFVLVFILTLCLFPLKSQDFLGKSKSDILQFIEKNKVRISQNEVQNDSISFLYEEEDEINRMFNINYTFSFLNDTCICYSRRLPVNSYFLKTISDMVSTKNGKSLGDMLSVEGETFYSCYEFENFFLRLEFEEDIIIEKFEEKR